MRKVKSYTPHWRPGQNDKRKKRTHLRNRVIVISTVAIVLVVLLGVLLLFLPIGKQNRIGYAYVYPTSTINSVTEQLENEIGLNTPALFKFYANLCRLDNKLREGRYAVTGKMSSYAILHRLISEGQQPVKVSFSSVRTQKELVEKLTANLQMSTQELESLLANASFCATYGLDTATIRCLFIPDSYEFYWNVKPKALVEKIASNYQNFWNENRKKKLEEEGLKPSDISIIASIVEEESNKTDEYSRIAGLYINRLRRGMPLQADPTVKFALQNFALKRITSAQTATDSPYNTYRIIGLPPGPIRYPQKSTLEKVLNYEPHRFIYMCAKSDLSGYHVFATNYTDHLSNAYRYQRKLDSLQIKAEQ